MPAAARMRLVILPISTFGAIGTPGHAFIGELSCRMRASVPYSLHPHASWATPRLSPMIRMSLTSCRPPRPRGVCARQLAVWRR